jgi:hypothetical protein
VRKVRPKKVGRVRPRRIKVHPRRREVHPKKVVKVERQRKKAVTLQEVVMDPRKVEETRQVVLQKAETLPRQVLVMQQEVVKLVHPKKVEQRQPQVETRQRKAVETLLQVETHPRRGVETPPRPRSQHWMVNIEIFTCPNYLDKIANNAACYWPK